MYEVFEQLLQENGLSARQVSLDTGIGTATFSDWKRGRSTPKYESMQKIARFLDVPVEYLKTGIKKEPVNTDKLPETVAQAIELFGALPPAEQEKALALLKVLVEKQ